MGKMVDTNAGLVLCMRVELLSCRWVPEAGQTCAAYRKPVIFLLGAYRLVFLSADKSILLPDYSWYLPPLNFPGVH